MNLNSFNKSPSKMLFDDPAKEEFVQENILANNYYYQKRVIVDPERCKVNLERAIKRKERESQVFVSCTHNSRDWCQVRAIPFEELEDFHDRYWDCSGTVNKRVFVAKYLSVEPVTSPKKDLNITCHIERSDGTLILVCQKSFISILGVSKHKVLAIGKAKLTNSEQLQRETRGGRRIKGMKNHLNRKESDNNSTSGGWFDDSFDSESGTSSKRMKMDESHEGSINSEMGLYLNVEIDDEEDENGNDDDDDDDEEDEHRNSKSTQQQSEDEIDIFQPEVELTETSAIRTHRGFIINPKTQADEDDDDDGEPTNIKPGANWLKKPIRPIRKRPHSNTQWQGQQTLRQKQLEAAKQQQQIAAARKRQQQQFAFQHEQRKFQQSRNIDQQPFEMVECQMVDGENSSNHLLKSPFLGPENWQNTINRQIRKQENAKLVTINCTHALTRFCKIQRIPMQDLVNFHNAFWRCNGIIEERLFLARWLIVQPKNHRREMAICHRIPCRDGAIYEVCQKSFLSVVGITKHKVQSAARAKLRGELFKKDGRGGNHASRQALINANRLRQLPQTQSSKIQISNVVGNYDIKREIDDIEIKNEPTIEINDSDDEADNENDNNYNQINQDEESHLTGDQNFAVDPADIEEKYKKIINRMKLELEFYKRRNQKLSTDRRKLFSILDSNAIKDENKLKTSKNMKRKFFHIQDANNESHSNEVLSKLIKKEILNEEQENVKVNQEFQPEEAENEKMERFGEDKQCHAAKIQRPLKHLPFKEEIRESDIVQQTQNFSKESTLQNQLTQDEETDKRQKQKSIVSDESSLLPQDTTQNQNSFNLTEPEAVVNESNILQQQTDNQEIDETELQNTENDLLNESEIHDQIKCKQEISDQDLKEQNLVKPEQNFLDQEQILLDHEQKESDEYQQNNLEIFDNLNNSIDFDITYSSTNDNNMFNSIDEIFSTSNLNKADKDNINQMQDE